MNKVTAASLLLVLQKGAQRSLGLVSTLILARLLTPEDFGIIAIAMLVLWFVQTLTKAGAEAYIIQKHQLDDKILNSAWTLDLILINSSFLILCFCAPLASKYYGDDSLTTVIIAIGLILPISSLRNPGIWILQRNQDYSKAVKVSIFTKVIGVAVTIPAAYYFQSYWAIVVGQITSAILGTSLSYRISAYRPRIDSSNISTQWHFSKWVIPQEVLSYFRSHIDTLIVSGRLPSAELGAYNNMKYFAAIPMLQLMTPIVAPLHAEMGKVQFSVGEMKFQSDITIKIMAFIAAPFAALGFVGSEEIIALVLGDQWTQYHRVFAYFSLMIVPSILLTQSVRLLVVKYHTKLVFLYEVIFTFVLTFFLILTPLPSVEEFAIFRIISESMMSAFLYCYTSWLIFEKLGIKIIINVLTPSLIITIILAIFDGFNYFNVNPFIDLIILGSVCLISIIVLVSVWYKCLATSRERNAFIKFSPVKFIKN